MIHFAVDVASYFMKLFKMSLIYGFGFHINGDSFGLALFFPTQEHMQAFLSLFNIGAISIWAFLLPYLPAIATLVDMIADCNKSTTKSLLNPNKFSLLALYTGCFILLFSTH